MRTAEGASQAIVEFRGDPSLAPAAIRAFAGLTRLDLEADALPVDARPIRLKLGILLLRAYRQRVSPHLGNRCVFDPSCSRYAELALRKHGVIRGALLTARRLIRCRPGFGGQDIP